MGKKVFILGAGGMAREVLDLYIDLGREKDVLGFLEDDCMREGECLNGKLIHDMSCLTKYLRKNRPSLIAGIGTTKRRHLIEKLEREAYDFDTIIHPTAMRSRWVQIGEGSIVAAGVIMTCQIQVGRHVILNFGAHLAHDVKIGDFSTLSPGSNVMGHVTLGEGVLVGTDATIIEEINVGNGAIIAAGAVVTRDVPEMALVAGVPAKIKKIYKSTQEKPW